VESLWRLTTRYYEVNLEGFVEEILSVFEQSKYSLNYNISTEFALVCACCLIFIEQSKVPGLELSRVSAISQETRVSLCSNEDNLDGHKTIQLSKNAPYPDSKNHAAMAEKALTSLVNAMRFKQSENVVVKLPMVLVSLSLLQMYRTDIEATDRWDATIILET
jgi:hypothetical protein